MLTLGDSLLEKWLWREEQGVAGQSLASAKEIKHGTHGCSQPFQQNQEQRCNYPPKICGGHSCLME